MSAAARRAILLALLMLNSSGCRDGKRSGDYYAGHNNFRKHADRPPARRVVSLAPNLTEIVFSIGAGAQLVGRTRYCDTPKRAKSVRSIGGFIDPHLETILALKPDLILATKNSGNFEPVKRLERMKLPVYWSRIQTSADILTTIAHLGHLTGRQKQATELAQRIRRRLSAIDRRTRRKKKTRVLIIYGHRPLIAAGPKSYGAQLLKLINAENVLANSISPYPTIGPESLFSLKPDVIIDSYMGRSSRVLVKKFWARYRTLEAVKRNRIAFPESNFLLRPGPRVADAAAWLERVVYRAPGPTLSGKRWE